jgi:hypothetical protein
MGLLHHWKCDDNAANTSILATVGTNIVTGGTNTSSLRTTGPGGLYPYAFLLNGTSQFLDAALASISFSSGNAFSIGMFFKTSVIANTGLAGTTSTANSRIFVNGITVISVTSTSTTTLGWDLVDTLLVDTWYHILVTRTAGNICRVFINGVESSEGGQSLPGTFALTVFGRRNTNYLPGSICGIKVFDSDESDNALTLANEMNFVPTKRFAFQQLNIPRR